MVLKPIHEIGPDDLQALLDNNVRESKTIEYKLELPDNADRRPSTPSCPWSACAAVASASVK